MSYRYALLIGSIVTAIIVLFASYMGAYYTLLSGDQVVSYYDRNQRRMVTSISPVYSTGGMWPNSVFGYANQIDRMIRRKHWDAVARRKPDMEFVPSGRRP